MFVEMEIQDFKDDNDDDENVDDDDDKDTKGQLTALLSV